MSVVPMFLLMAVVLLAPHTPEGFAKHASIACLVLAVIFFIIEWGLKP